MLYAEKRESVQCAFILYLHLLSIRLLYNFTFANYTTKSHHHRSNNYYYRNNAVGLNTKAPALILIEAF